MKVNTYLTFFLAIITLILMSFHIPEKVQKKVEKEVKEVFEIQNFTFEPVQVSDTIASQLKSKISSDNFFKILTSENQFGYAYLGKARGKDDDFDYLVIFDRNLIIIKTKILIYRENYGGEISSKRWLKQFIGKSIDDKLLYEKDIIAISGATISAKAMTASVNNLLKSVAVLHKNNLLK